MDLQSRQSLLDVIMSRYHNMKQKKQLSRLFYVATKVVDSSASNGNNDENSNASGGGNYSSGIKKFHETLFSSLPEHKVSDFPFGLLFESQDHCLHVLEGKTECITQFLGLLYRSIAEDSACPITDVKILNITDDVGAFIFPRWSYLNVEQFQGDEDEEEPQFHKSSSSEGGDDLEGKVWIQLIHHTEHKVLNIGKKILPLGPKQMEMFLTAATNNVPYLVPSPMIMGVLSKCDQCLTLKDWMQIYDTSVDIELDNEIIYPQPEGLKYINELQA